MSLVRQLPEYCLPLCLAMLLSATSFTSLNSVSIAGVLFAGPILIKVVRPHLAALERLYASQCLLALPLTARAAVQCAAEFLRPVVPVEAETLLQVS